MAINEFLVQRKCLQRRAWWRGRTSAGGPPAPPHTSEADPSYQSPALVIWHHLTGKKS